MSNHLINQEMTTLKQLTLSDGNQLAGLVGFSPISQRTLVCNFIGGDICQGILCTVRMYHNIHRCYIS